MCGGFNLRFKLSHNSNLLVTIKNAYTLMKLIDKKCQFLINQEIDNSASKDGALNEKIMHAYHTWMNS